MANIAVESQWPFSRSELMAGLRRYLAASSLRLLDIQPIPLPTTMPGATYIDSGTTLSAISVGVRIDGVEQTLPLVLKEPPVSLNGRVLRTIGQREYGVYRLLAPHLPLLVPGLVAGDESEGWVILEVLTGLRPAPDWTRSDYEEALSNLVKMHDRFHGLSDVLGNYPWLARPLSDDYDETVQAASEAVEVLVADAKLTPLMQPLYIDLFHKLIECIDRIAEPLRSETFTLVHGDYWPGNIARPIDGRQIVFDWQLAGISPAILDMVGFVQSTRLYLEPAMPIADMILSYRDQAEQLFSPGWDDERFDQLWYHALMWRLATNWIGRLATMPPANYECLHDRFQHVWLEPAQTAVNRYL
jgi:hypothetical protein